MSNKILVLGATGNLGAKIVKYLLSYKAEVRIAIRPTTDPQKIQTYKDQGIEIHVVHEGDKAAMVNACDGAHCIVSALAGLSDIIYDLQLQWIDCAIEAGVKRFIPSDFCSDYRNLIEGSNRNLDMRKKFHNAIVDKKIEVVSIFNGAFMELLTGDMPLILRSQKKILCWGDPDQKMEFTHTEDVAAYTAHTAIASHVKRYHKIAGGIMSCNDFVLLLTRIKGHQYKLLRPGGISLLNILIKVTRLFNPAKKELYPAWQGMQYMRDMMEGRIDVQIQDTGLYPQLKWQTVASYLELNLPKEST